MNCVTCEMLISTADVLNEHGEAVFEVFASAVISLGFSFTAVILIGIYMLRTQFGLENQIGPDATFRLFGSVGRVALGLVLISSFTLWKFGVIDLMAEITSFASASVINFEDPRGVLNNIDPKYKGLAAIEHVIFDPLNRTLQGITGRGLLNVVTNFHLILGIVVLYLAGLAAIVIVFLYYIEFEFLKFVFTAFAPLMIFAWVFEITRPAAWAAAKIFMQSILTLLLVSGVAAIIQAIFAPIEGEVPDRDVDGNVTAPIAGFENFFSGEEFFAMFVGTGVSNVLLILLKVVAILVVFGGIPSLRSGR